jgi:protein involved in polysaccharide export with SLBB domain
MVLPAEPITVSKAVALAGGATRLAALEKVQVLRTDAAGVKKTITVDVKKALEGKATKEEDPVVLPGDQITVHESHF